MFKFAKVSALFLGLAVVAGAGLSSVASAHTQIPQAAWQAEGGADRLQQERVAEGGADRLRELGLAEGGADRLNALHMA